MIKINIKCVVTSKLKNNKNKTPLLLWFFYGATVYLWMTTYHLCVFGNIYYWIQFQWWFDVQWYCYKYFLKNYLIYKLHYYACDISFLYFYFSHHLFYIEVRSFIILMSNIFAVLPYFFFIYFFISIIDIIKNNNVFNKIQKKILYYSINFQCLYL